MVSWFSCDRIFHLNQRLKRDSKHVVINIEFTKDESSILSTSILTYLLPETYKKMFTKIVVLYIFKVEMYTKNGFLTYVAENR